MVLGGHFRDALKTADRVTGKLKSDKTFLSPHFFLAGFKKQNQGQEVFSEYFT